MVSMVFCMVSPTQIVGRQWPVRKNPTTAAARDRLGQPKMRKGGGERNRRPARRSVHRGNIAEAHEQRLAGGIVHAVIVGDDKGIAGGVDGETFDLVDDITV